MVTNKKFELRPGIINPQFWCPDRSALEKKQRKAVLERDNYTCVSCDHRALKYMNLHHLEESEDNSINNLATMCVACHAVMHIGRNLALGTIEIWASEISQVDIVRQTRAGIRVGETLEQIKKGLPIKKPHSVPPNSVEWANSLVKECGQSGAARCSLKPPLCAIFVKFKRWQIESEQTTQALT